MKIIERKYITECSQIHFRGELGRCEWQSLDLVLVGFLTLNVLLSLGFHALEINLNLQKEWLADLSAVKSNMPFE